MLQIRIARSHIHGKWGVDQLKHCSFEGSETDTGSARMGVVRNGGGIVFFSRSHKVYAAVNHAYVGVQDHLQHKKEEKHLTQDNNCCTVTLTVVLCLAGPVVLKAGRFLYET